MSGNSIERILDKIDADISSYLIFAGVLDNNAKLLSSRRGKASFSLPIERHDTLDVQLSLMFSLIRQLEDISGVHRFTVTRFAKHDIFLFGTSELHVFVITSPTSEGQVVKTLAELVATMNDTDPQTTAAALASRTKDQAMAATITSTMIRHDDHSIDRQKFSPHPKPEIVAILQGYLMALEPGCTIHDDVGGHYKIKASNSDRFTWSTLQKIHSAFNDRIEIHHIGLDADGKVFLRFSLRY
ncbi:MAG TPA: hypothetical protein VJZ68_00905 [Nitrososphaera sp.]|nr:hypothetical protein [Nitrososphaera sp.]